MFLVPTKLIIQPGLPVDRGFLIYESSDNKACEMNTVSGTKRSEIMIHEDKRPVLKFASQYLQGFETNPCRLTFNIKTRV